MLLIHVLFLQTGRWDQRYTGRDDGRVRYESVGREGFLRGLAVDDDRPVID